MTSFRILLVSSSALALSSCSWFNKGGGQGNYDTTGGSNGYDTSNPYGVPGGNSQAVPYQQPAAAPGSSTYGQAAYEDNTTAPVTPAPAPAPAATPRPAPRPAASTPAASPAPKPSAPEPIAGSGKVHVVGKGDTLWGIGKKYGVSVDSIKKANGLTKDTVVLGAKLQIPAK
ncbi:MAG: putative endopeptidase p60 [Akkermansiaceae bacterium]|nr:putative endopeptidase p60 [Akkermansiaceae bacterium]